MAIIKCGCKETRHITKRLGTVEVLICQGGLTAGAKAQDARYGPGMRVHSECAAGFRCSICLAERHSASGKVSKGKKAA